MSRLKKNIVISGLTAAGKTTHSTILSNDFGLNHVEASKILLENSNITQRSRDFWISEKAKKLFTQDNWREIDKKLLQIESSSDYNVFDCLSLAWLSDSPLLSIWLDSSLSSRVLKAIVSYHGESTRPIEEVESGIKLKDNAAKEFLQSSYNFDLFYDRKPFWLILDISKFIASATEESSRNSIRCVDEIIHPVVEWYLNDSDSARKSFLRQYQKFGSSVIRRYPKEILI